MRLLCGLFVYVCLVAFCIADDKKRCKKFDWTLMKPITVESTKSTCFGAATTSKFVDKVRQRIVDYHNAIRAQVANGCAKTKKGMLPSASNMRLLTYNCSLEKSAQEWANGCPSKHSNKTLRPMTGENMFQLISIDKSLLKADPFKKAFNAFYGELTKNGSLILDNLTYQHDLIQIGHFTQQIWAETISIGCGIAECNQLKNGKLTYNGFKIVCHYYPQGNIITWKIYEKGAPCKKNSDCLDKTYNKCVRKLGLCTTGK